MKSRTDSANNLCNKKNLFNETSPKSKRKLSYKSSMKVSPVKNKQNNTNSTVNYRFMADNSFNVKKLDTKEYYLNSGHLLIKNNHSYVKYESANNLLEDKVYSNEFDLLRNFLRNTEYNSNSSTITKSPNLKHYKDIGDNKAFKEYLEIHNKRHEPKIDKFKKSIYNDKIRNLISSEREILNEENRSRSLTAIK